MEADLLLVYTAVGGFFLFVLLMAFGGHVMPTGSMMRDPTRRGDIAIAIFSVVGILFLLWVTYGGWKHFFGVAPPPKIEQALIAPTAVQGVTHIVFLQPQAMEKPAVAKRQLRRYCDDYLNQHPGESGQCVVFAWLDARILPRAFPISGAALAGMSANYVFNRVGEVDRFCWLERGRVVEANCF